jgi:hypothetical protein
LAPSAANIFPTWTTYFPALATICPSQPIFLPALAIAKIIIIHSKLVIMRICKTGNSGMQDELCF